MMFSRNQLKVTETVRWPSEAVGGRDESTASEGHRTKAQISAGCGIATISLLLLMPAYPWVRQAVSEEPRPITQPAVYFVAKDIGPLGKRGWSKIITRETIEDEVKRLKILIDKDVTTLEQFARGGYKKARRHFSELAALFAIIEQNDVMTRWMREAPDLKNRFARSARACKVGSRQAFTEASRRKEDLKTIVGGGKLQLADKIEKRPWGEILDRSPLMQRMNSLFQEELKVHVADKKTFAANRDRIKHNAELISAISTILRQP
ncbi:MAG: hypothetical protein IH991_24510, partial [Planctomycetes bacterium]|nr:hypothetical protein [Planctomycetota bacterium]